MFTTCPGGGVITPDTTLDSTTHGPTGTPTRTPPVPCVLSQHSASQGHIRPSAVGSDARFEDDCDTRFVPPADLRALHEHYLDALQTATAAYHAWDAAVRADLEARS